jgi:hypothetical protein
MADFIEAHGKDGEAQLLVYYAGHGHTSWVPAADGSPHRPHRHA